MKEQEIKKEISLVLNLDEKNFLDDYKKITEERSKKITEITREKLENKDISPQKKEEITRNILSLDDRLNFRKIFLQTAQTKEKLIPITKEETSREPERENNSQEGGTSIPENTPKQEKEFNLIPESQKGTAQQKDSIQHLETNPQLPTPNSQPTSQASHSEHFSISNSKEDNFSLPKKISLITKTALKLKIEPQKIKSTTLEVMQDIESDAEIPRFPYSQADIESMIDEAISKEMRPEEESKEIETHKIVEHREGGESSTEQDASSTEDKVTPKPEESKAKTEGLPTPSSSEEMHPLAGIFDDDPEKEGKFGFKIKAHRTGPGTKKKKYPHQKQTSREFASPFATPNREFDENLSTGKLNATQSSGLLPGLQSGIQDKVRFDDVVQKEKKERHSDDGGENNPQQTVPTRDKNKKQTTAQPTVSSTPGAGGQVRKSSFLKKAIATSAGAGAAISWLIGGGVAMNS